MNEFSLFLRRNSSIYRIREFPLRQVELDDEYEIIQLIGQGKFAELYLVEHKETNSEVVLRTIRKNDVSKSEFYREFHYSYYLSPHINVLSTYDVAFQTSTSYVFAQEYAPLGDLSSYITKSGIGEQETKRVAQQIASALEFIHSKDLVHRDISLSNILVFESDFSKVKLCNFASVRRRGDLIKKTHLNSYSPPELFEIPYNQSYGVDCPQDVWQLFVLICVLLTGALPWQRADSSDPKFYNFSQWEQRAVNKIPHMFAQFSPKLLKLLQRSLNLDPEKRIAVSEIAKYMDCRWLVKIHPKRDKTISDQINANCSKNYQLIQDKLRSIKNDKNTQRDRIYDWIMSTHRIHNVNSKILTVTVPLFSISRTQD